MNDARVVRGGETAGQIDQRRKEAVAGDRAASELRPQRLAADQLRDQIERAVELVERKNCRD